MINADLDLACSTVQQAIQRICEHYQVDYVTLHVFRSGEDAENKPYVRTNYPDAWVRHYLLNDYVRIDPVLQMAEQVAGPFCWSTITPQGQQLEMMQQAVQHGLGQTGFSVRTSMPSVVVACFRSMHEMREVATTGSRIWQECATN